MRDLVRGKKKYCHIPNFYCHPHMGGERRAELGSVDLMTGKCQLSISRLFNFQFQKLNSYVLEEAKGGSESLQS